jgi:hypothetical protein
MKKALVVLSMLIATSALADERFSADKNFTNNSTITWRVVSDVQSACEKESKRLGLGGFGYGVEACSFWDKKGSQDICTIITAKHTTHDTLAHEVRHCFQGSFHK